MIEKQRQHALLRLLQQEGFASVPRLAARLSASEATIRRDICKLADEKQLKKIRGGAEALNLEGVADTPKPLQASEFKTDLSLHKENKMAIAAKAVSLCRHGESIIINGGSSTFMMKDNLALRPDLKVLTNSFALAHELSQVSDIQVTLPGGELYREQSIILSSFDNDFIANYHGTKMFMGTPGIGEFGVMEADPLLVRSEQKLKKQADSLIVLADSSKLGKPSNFILCSLDEVDVVITDSGITPFYIDLFQRHNIEIIIADH